MTISLRPLLVELFGVRGQCAMASCVRTTTNRRLQNGYIGVDRHHPQWEQALPISGVRGKLALGNLDMLPAEQTRIDRPCTGSYHRQCGTQCYQQDGNPATGTKISHQYFNSCDQLPTARSQ